MKLNVVKELRDRMTTDEWTSLPALITSQGKVYSFAKSAAWIQKLSSDLSVQNTRVAVVIHNRLYSGIVSIAVMEENLCVPLNPQYKDDELRALIDETEVSAIVVDKMFHQTRKNLLDTLRIPVLVFDEGKNEPVIRSYEEGEVSEQDELRCEVEPGLLLLTSGTTGCSKQVVLDHSNLKHGVNAVGESLQLTVEDRAVNMLPMFHIGGLFDLLLTPLYYGCSVLFLDAKEVQMNARFITDRKVTWIQGSPAILQHLLRVVDYDESASKLRMIRSVSAPLSEGVFHELEKIFDVPVVEIYGMSETAGVITSNPISRERCKVGSVGRVVNAEISLRNDGEIWVKSAGLFNGYFNVEKSSEDWDGDWFHTGDLGYLDKDDFLFLTGRSKEQINRGGQKVSPVEIDQIMEAWEEVTEVASFGIPHASLGEDVAVAVVLAEGHRLELDEVKSRLGERLADYKLPCKVIYLEALPRNQNGKLQRNDLLGEYESSSGESESTDYDETETLVHSLFCKVLELDKVGLEEDFFEAGGDSLSAVSLVTLLEKNVSANLGDFRIFEHSSVRKVSSYIRDHSVDSGGKVVADREVAIQARLAKKLQQILATWQGVPAFVGAYCVMPNRGGRSDIPYLFFCGNGNQEYDVFCKAAEGIYHVVGFRTLRRIQHKWFRDLDRLAEAYVYDVIKVQKEGPYYIGGYCEGANIMIRVAQLLIQRGLEVRQIIFHDHIVDKPINAHVSMLFSEKASMNQLRFYYDVERGWNKLFKGKYGFIELLGGHNRYGEAGFECEIRPFLLDEFQKLTNSRLSDIGRDEHQVDFKVISELPRILKVGREYSLKLRVMNKGSNDLVESDGYAVHARWIDLAGDLKFKVPMRARLPKCLASGESVEVDVIVVPKKRKRLYRLELAVIEEGFDWARNDKRYLHRWYLLI